VEYLTGGSLSENTIEIIKVCATKCQFILCITAITESDVTGTAIYSLLLLYRWIICNLNLNL